MSVTVVRDKEVTVVTVRSDSKSVVPPICQILFGICYSPMCCSVRKELLQNRAVPVLGVIMIMVGLFNIGLMPGREEEHFADFVNWGAGYWLGGVYIVVGIISILTERFPSVCLVGIAVIVNIAGCVFAIIGIVWYSVTLAQHNITRQCGWEPQPSEACSNVAATALRLLLAMDITMIVMAVLQLCVCISFTVIAIKALRNKRNIEDDREELISSPDV